MYFIELLVKKLKKSPKVHNFEEQTQEGEQCEHIFMPLDSDKEYFACKNCGLVVNKDQLNNSFNHQ